MQYFSSSSISYSFLLLSLQVFTLIVCDDAERQLLQWASLHMGREVSTSQNGIPVLSLTASLTVGPTQSPILLQDANLIEHLAHFNRERIPERVVHAKGGGAFGSFEVTHDVTQFTKAGLFRKIGLKTPVLIRFSTTVPESGGADTIRDGRGFAVKFYTDEGNWDLVGNNLPVFPIRDPILFPSLIRSRKRNPVTHLKDANSFWDFVSLRPESTFHTLMLFSDLGLPDGFRFQDGFGVHTFKLINKDGQKFYAKFHFKSDQGLKFLTPSDALRLTGEEPDYANRDLYNSIERGEFPSWSMGVQIMTFDEAEKYKWDPFDITKIWREVDFPIRPIGKLTLHKNPSDYFTQIEEAAFSPSLMVDGIEPSPDRMLHARMFSYPDTQRYRLGVNYLQLPVNRPSPKIVTATYLKDGLMCLDDNGGGVPNYFPNSFNGPVPKKLLISNESLSHAAGDIVRNDIGGDDNYSQPDWYWKSQLSEGQRSRIVHNLAEAINGIPSLEVRSRVITKMFDPVNSELSYMLRSAIKSTVKSPRSLY